MKIETPTISPLAWYLAGTERGGIAIHSDKDARAFPPRLKSGADLEPVNTARLVKSGTIYSATRVAAKADSFVLALIDLQGGGRLLARLRSDADTAEMIGQQAELVSDKAENEPFLTFGIRPAERHP